MGVRIAYWMAAATLLLVLSPGTGFTQDEPSRLMLDTAEYHLKEFEKQVARANGRPMEMTDHGRQALTRIRDLRRKWPDHPRVKEMFERARVAYTASKGTRVEVPEEMLAYRTRAAEIRDALRKTNVAAWDAFQQKLAAEGKLVDSPFPIPDPETVVIDEWVGRRVVLEGFRWPLNEYTHNGDHYTYVGSPATGYWFVRSGQSPDFLAPYGAIQRYRRQVTGDLPEEWTLVGEIVSPAIMVPERGEEKTMDAQIGWKVKPLAIWLDNLVLAVADANSPTGGTFAGEAGLDDLLREGWSVTAEQLPDEVTPERVIELVVTAVKEKNWPLFLACFDPSLRETDVQLDGLRQFYEVWQRSLAKDYVLAKVDSVEDIEVLDAGASRSNDLRHMFDHPPTADGDDGGDAPKVESVKVWVSRFTHEGTMFGSKKPVTLRRSSANEKPARWALYSGFPF